VESTRRQRGPKWAKYLDQFGTDDTERADHIRQAQQNLLRWAQTSPLPLHVIDTSRSDWDNYAEQVTDLITT
jgi:hypothetical protein